MMVSSVRCLVMVLDGRASALVRDDGLGSLVSVLSLVTVVDGWVSSDGRDCAVSACSR